MDSYLAIAQATLRGAKIPLSPRGILKWAYKSNIVPAALYGKTQHKTLQARLSEDILLKRERSAFFRTAPGRFFLREFLADPEVPVKYRVPIIARRRQRDLPVKRALALSSEICDSHDAPTIWSPDKGIGVLRDCARAYYIEASNARPNCEILVWSYTVVCRGKHVLTYRHGQYRESREGFIGNRSIGFFTPVSEHDSNLFDQATLGIIHSSLSCVHLDLDFDAESVWGQLSSVTELKEFLFVENLDHVKDLLAVIKFECPLWLEPLTRRLSLNDLRWQDLSSPINHLEDFDPWSRAVLARLVGGQSEEGLYHEGDHQSPYLIPRGNLPRASTGRRRRQQS